MNLNGYPFMSMYPQYISYLPTGLPTMATQQAYPYGVMMQSPFNLAPALQPASYPLAPNFPFPTVAHANAFLPQMQQCQPQFLHQTPVMNVDTVVDPPHTITRKPVLYNKTNCVKEKSTTLSPMSTSNCNTSSSCDQQTSSSAHVSSTNGESADTKTTTNTETSEFPFTVSSHTSSDLAPISLLYPSVAQAYRTPEVTTVSFTSQAPRTMSMTSNHFNPLFQPMLLHHPSTHMVSQSHLSSTPTPPPSSNEDKIVSPHEAVVAAAAAEVVVSMAQNSLARVRAREFAAVSAVVAANSRLVHQQAGAELTSGSGCRPGIMVPTGWTRLVDEWEGCVVYISPTGIRLNSASEVERYLQEEGTCKCGLRCPLDHKKTFDFRWTVPSLCSDRPEQEEVSKTTFQAGCVHRHDESSEIEKDNSNTVTGSEATDASDIESRKRSHEDSGGKSDDEQNQADSSEVIESTMKKVKDETTILTSSTVNALPVATSNHTATSPLLQITGGTSTTAPTPFYPGLQLSGAPWTPWMNNLYSTTAQQALLLAAATANSPAAAFHGLPATAGVLPHMMQQTSLPPAALQVSASPTAVMVTQTPDTTGQES